MSTPEQQERTLNAPGSCGRDCQYRGTGSCSFEVCPYDEFPVHQGGNTTDECIICGNTITRSQLSSTLNMCPTCIERLKFLLVDEWGTLNCLVSTGGFEGYCK